MKAVFVLLAISLTGCARNVGWVKERASTRWAELGYSVVAYEGYNWAPIAGGDVWYLLKRADSPGILYTGYLQRWGDELHVYGPKVISGQQIQYSEAK